MDFKQQSAAAAEARALIQRIPELGKPEVEKRLRSLLRKSTGIDKMLVSRYFEALAVYGLKDEETSD